MFIDLDGVLINLDKVTRISRSIRCGDGSKIQSDKDILFEYEIECSTYDCGDKEKQEKILKEIKAIIKPAKIKID